MSGPEAKASLLDTGSNERDYSACLPRKNGKGGQARKTGLVYTLPFLHASKAEYSLSFGPVAAIRLAVHWMVFGGSSMSHQ